MAKMSFGVSMSGWDTVRTCLAMSVPISWWKISMTELPLSGMDWSRVLAYEGLGRWLTAWIKTASWISSRIMSIP